MNARDTVLQRIRTATEGSLRPALDRRYHGADDSSASLERFEERVLDYRARVHRCSADKVPALLAQLTEGESVVVPDGLPVAWATSLRSVIDRSLSAAELDKFDAVVTTCAIAVAETGTIVLDGGRGQGRRALSLVPDHHVLIVREEQVCATVPQAVARLDPCRPLTWISGPSATSDIELHRVEGVHGPRRLDVLLVAGATKLEGRPDRHD